MHHVIAGCGFLLVLLLPFWWSWPREQAGDDGVGLVFAPIALAIYGIVSILALAMYFALFRASMLAIGLVAALIVAILACWKLHWIDGLESLESGALAAAILIHHVILRSFGVTLPAN